MQNRSVLVALLLLPSILAAQSPGGAAGRAPSPSVEQAVRRANDQEVQAFLRKDVATLDSLWAADFVVSNPLDKVASKQQVLAMVRTDTLAFHSYDRQIELVRAYGDMVLVMGSEQVVWAGKMPLAGRPSLLRFTALWMPMSGRWVEVARHANVVPPR